MDEVGGIKVEPDISSTIGGSYLQETIACPSVPYSSAGEKRYDM